MYTVKSKFSFSTYELVRSNGLNMADLCDRKIGVGQKQISCYGYVLIKF